jgi:tRNA (uracil-5-)-methyltransferase TRM9
MISRENAGRRPAANQGHSPAAGSPTGGGLPRQRSQTDGSVSSAGLYAGMVQTGSPKRASIVESYDHYYGSGLYDARYPRPNPATYRSALRLARASARILDFGAGSGRYALPILHSTNAFVCAYDVSADACKALDLQATAAGIGSQRLLVTADLDAARAAGPYDLVLSLFGVLSHIEGIENRLSILNSIRSVLTRQGLLLATVPNAIRRFPMHASSDGHVSEGSGTLAVQANAYRYFHSPRQITYRHHVENEERSFPYYLFSCRELTAELSAAGFGLDVLEPDSILPERKLVRSPVLARVDDVLCRLLPTWAGYGLRATCRVARSDW